MGKITILCLLLGLSLTATNLNAQMLNGHYMPFGMGYARQTVKDAALSPVSYTGGIGLITSGYYHQNQKWLSSFDLTGFSGFQKPDINAEGNNNRTLLISARAIYSLSYKVLEVGNWQFLTGLLSHNVWDYREVSAFRNSSANFNGYFSFGLQFTAQNFFDLFNENFGLQYSMGLPVGTYYLRPGFIRPFFNQSISDRNFAFWGDFFLIDLRTDLLWELNSSNLLRLSYQWEYSSLNVLNKIQTASHFLSLSTIFRF